MNHQGNKTFQLKNGDEITLSEQAYIRYVEWRNGMLIKAGNEIAAKMPKFYGNVQLNLHGGSCKNVNVHETII